MQLPEHVVEAMITHALDDAPNEACGLVYRFGRRWRVVRAANDSLYPWQGFALKLPALRLPGSLVAVYHSHPQGGVEPSAGDLRAVQQTPRRLHHFIVDPLTDRVVCYAPGGIASAVVER